MDTPVDITDAPNAVPLQVKQGAIQFQNVSFEYPDDHNHVLHNIHLSIAPGERLALVGPSGGGKTTLCSLIPRFYDVTEGAIYIDGQDIRTVTLQSLRNAIGIVQQDVYLFSGTVAENIAYGKPNASEAEIQQAAARAGAAQIYPSAAPGIPYLCGRTGRKAIRRTKTAHRHRPHLFKESADFDFRRSHQRFGQRKRNYGKPKPGSTGPRPHHADYCPSSDHHKKLRSDSGAGL